MKTFLNDVPPIDWEDLEQAHEITSSILRQLAADKATLRRLLLAVEHTPDLMTKCELHSLDDKIVIYDGMTDQNFRIRFRLSNIYQDERPHTHRFSFTTLILRGTYWQTWYSTRRELDEQIDVSEIIPVCSREEPAGSSFTIHHDAIHSTITPPDTVSLILRGPAAKRRAIITHKESGHVWWRYGEADESKERRQEVKMPLARYHEWCRKLEERDII